jgi:hypothetical protein
VLQAAGFANPANVASATGSAADAPPPALESAALAAVGGGSLSGSVLSGSNGTGSAGGSNSSSNSSTRADENGNTASAASFASPASSAPLAASFATTDWADAERQFAEQNQSFCQVGYASVFSGAWFEDAQVRYSTPCCSAARWRWF